MLQEEGLLDQKIYKSAFFFFLSKEKGSKNHLEDKYVASGIKDLEQLGLNKRKKLDRMDNWLCP